MLYSLAEEGMVFALGEDVLTSSLAESMDEIRESVGLGESITSTPLPGLIWGILSFLLGLCVESAP